MLDNFLVGQSEFLGSPLVVYQAHSEDNTSENNQ